MKEDTSFIDAAEKNDAERLAREIAKGVDVNMLVAGGTTALMLVVEHADDGLAAMKLLLDKGADPNRKDEGGYTALMYAVRAGGVETVLYLINHGAEIDAKNSQGSALCQAVAEDNIEALRLLIERGADMSICDSMGFGAQWYAKTFKPDLVPLLNDAPEIRRRYLEGKAAVAAQKQKALKARAPKVVFT
jgi:ankyrin repeat protein